MCRDLYNNGLIGTLPTELGNLDALTQLCVRPHPPRLPRVRRNRVMS